MRSFRVAPVLLAVALISGATPGAAESPAVPGRPRTLAVIPFYTPEKMWQLYSPLVIYLRQETGEAWELKLFPDHDEMVRGFCAGEADVALFGPVPLSRVNAACGATAFLIPLGQDGRPSYRSILLTGDAAVRTIADLRGKKVGFFKGSTAAHILPLKNLREAGLAPGSFDEVFLESQDKLIAALLELRISGAGVKETLYRRFEKEPLRVLQTSEAVPNFAFCALPTQPAAVRERFVAALLKLRPRESPADAQTVGGWDDEIKNGFTLPAPDFLPAVLELRAVTERLLQYVR